MKEPMKEKESRSRSFRKTQRGFNASTWSLQLLRRSIRQAGRGDECSHDSELSAEATAQYRHEGKSQR